MRIPGATYRLQLNDGFTLQDARAIVPYLARLGITDLYLSPIFEAKPGSTHGYDVIDPTRISEMLGGEGALEELVGTVREYGMGILLDIVPNHMAAHPRNRWWRDVLQRGPSSTYAQLFDIDWSRNDRVVLPVLGDELETVLARGEITLDLNARELVYHEHRLPLADRPRAPVVTDQATLRALLGMQHYELHYWRHADRINYRRFFDITDLIGVRVELDDAFQATHALVRELAATGAITGMRIDHIDGLRDPAGYLTRLREHVRDPDGAPVYTVVEKILQHHERLPDWQCEGTTGYDFLNLATGTLIDPGGFARIQAFYSRITGDPRAFDELAREKKLLVMDRLFPGELRVLTDRMTTLVGGSTADCVAAIREVTASLAVYRTYVRSFPIRHEDGHRIDSAVAEARLRQSALRPILDALCRVMHLDHESRHDALEWVARWQQFTGPVMAKGIEDTALYCHNALLAANEVGSDPPRPCVTVPDLVATLQERSERLPHSQNATATHDTKRGEDTRARIAVVSEVVDEWRSLLRRWLREGDEWKSDATDDEDRIVADADVDSLLYQTLVGAWPVYGLDDSFAERVQQYMTKAVREAKENTSWRRPDEDYEHALASFVARLMNAAGRSGLQDEIAGFARRLAPHGACNSLAQLVLKVTAPGVPDFYQGTELWSLTLVDPDNRQPVDFATRQRMLEDIAPLLDAPRPDLVHRLLLDWQDGRIKLYVTAATLHCRSRHRDAFDRGSIAPVEVSEAHDERVIAYARSHRTDCVVAAFARWSTRARNDPFEWQDARLRLPGRRSWRDALSGAVFGSDPVRLAEVFQWLPCALLEPLHGMG